jgi:hypothetical protein
LPRPGLAARRLRRLYNVRINHLVRQFARAEWEDLTARALAVPAPYRPVPGMAVYHVRAGHHVVMIAEHDLAGPLLNHVIAVLALGDLV